jgi:hypothetical protein
VLSGRIMALLPLRRRFGLDTQQRNDFEPVDKPLRFYETGLCLAAQLPAFVALRTHNPSVELAAAVSMALLIALSLWKLVMPPRFSATRVAFVFVGLLYLFLLWNP